MPKFEFLLVRDCGAVVLQAAVKKAEEWRGTEAEGHRQVISRQLQEPVLFASSSFHNTLITKCAPLSLPSCGIL
jgi:hypothetical protein